MTLLFLVLALVGFVLSSLYSGLETGVYTLDRVGLAVRAARRDPAALRIRLETSRSTRLLIVLLVGTNASNYLGSYGLAEFLHRQGFDEWTLVLLEAAIFTPLVFVFAETLPKDLFRTHTDRWTYVCSPVITVTRLVFTACGLVPMLEGLMRATGRFAGREGPRASSSRERVSELIREGAGRGGLTETQTTIADRALGMRRRSIESVMVPWSRVTALTAQADRQSREVLIRTRPYTRMPVLGRDGSIIGIVSWVDLLLDADAPTDQLLQPPLSIPPGTQVLDALAMMRGDQRAMAIVRDDDSSKPLGIVTKKDLVEPLTGRLAAW